MHKWSHPPRRGCKSRYFLASFAVGSCSWVSLRSGRAATTVLYHTRPQLEAKPYVYNLSTEPTMFHLIYHTDTPRSTGSNDKERRRKEPSNARCKRAQEVAASGYAAQHKANHPSPTVSIILHSRAPIFFKSHEKRVNKSIPPKIQQLKTSVTPVPRKRPCHHARVGG